MKTHKIKRKANRVQRACYNCRKRKQGCDEERPCRRCIEKGIECVEVEPKRKRGRVRQPGQVTSHSDSPSSDVVHPPFEGSTDYYSDSSKYDDSSDVEVNPEMYDHHEHEELQFHGRDESSPLAVAESEDEDECCDEHDEKGSCLKDFNLAAVLPLIWNDLCAHPSASMDEMDLESVTPSDPNMDYPVGSPTFSSIDVWEASLDTEMKSDDYSMQVDNHPEEMMDCWRDLVRKIGSNENLRRQFARMKETWREIINALRTFDFQKVQSSLRELDPHDETSPPVVFWSSGGRILHASSAFCRLVGYSTEELRVVSESQNNKIRAHTLFHPEETVKILSRQLDAVQQPMLTSYQLKTRLLGKSKQEIPVSCSISNLRDPVGTPLLTMAHFSSDL